MQSMYVPNEQCNKLQLQLFDVFFVTFYMN